MSNMNLGRIGLWAADFDLQPMAKSQEAIAQVEEMGYGAVWVPEAVIREPFASTALLLSATKKIVLATGIASLHARTAQTMQAGWKTLTEAFPDRFLLGIGVSHAPMVQGVHKGTYDKPYSTMVEYLDAMDKGIFFGAAPTTAPQRVLAALGPKMLKLAAERGAGAHPYFTPVEHTAFARETMGKDALLAPELAVVLETDATKAREIARKYMTTYTRLPNYANNLKRFGFTDDEITNQEDRLVDAIVAWGSMDTVVAAVKGHLDAGANHVCIQVLTDKPGSLPMREWQELADATRSL
ncbi:MAG: LLM class F420-dependent oxidoreductase [Ilumatobacteraceae bacterium]|jgi:probable F420-dependent oxidoreductase|nr:LLM class F420-dependent oxidoreductase [Ilumatobacteraceae bacterium]